MAILAIDVGKGTEDLLIYDENQILENSIQVVWPSAAQLLYNRLKRVKKGNIIMQGEIMAGEPWHKIVYEKSKTPSTVFMTPNAAMSLRYDLDKVRERGVTILTETELEEIQGSRFETRDIIWERVQNLLNWNNIEMSDISKILLACQDHGDPPTLTQSVKDFRMEAIYSKLDKNGNLSDLLVSSNEIPDYLPRHKSIVKSASAQFPDLKPKDIMVMDSSPAVILGASQNSPSELVINLGNGHSLAVILEIGEVQAIYETHTGKVTPHDFFEDIKLLLDNKLTHDIALNKGAHGVYQRSIPSKKRLEEYYPFTLIGPNRGIISHQNAHLAHPGGNMMMAGPIGLWKAYSSK